MARKKVANAQGLTCEQWMEIALERKLTADDRWGATWKILSDAWARNESAAAWALKLKEKV